MGTASERVEDVEDLGEEEEDEVDLPAITEKKGSDFWKGQEKEDGVACILWFSQPEMLVSYIFDNTRPRDRHMEFYLKKVHVQNLPELKDIYDPELGIKKRWYDGDWYDFKEIDNGRWILRGKFFASCFSLPR